MKTNNLHTLKRHSRKAMLPLIILSMIIYVGTVNTTGSKLLSEQTNILDRKKDINVLFDLDAKEQAYLVDCPECLFS